MVGGPVQSLVWYVLRVNNVTPGGGGRRGVLEVEEKGFFLIVGGGEYKW